MPKHSVVFLQDGLDRLDLSALELLHRNHLELLRLLHKPLQKSHLPDLRLSYLPPKQVHDLQLLLHAQLLLLLHYLLLQLESPPLLLLLPPLLRDLLKLPDEAIGSFQFGGDRRIGLRLASIEPRLLEISRLLLAKLLGVLHLLLLTYPESFIQDLLDALAPYLVVIQLDLSIRIQQLLANEILHLLVLLGKGEVEETHDQA